LSDAELSKEGDEFKDGDGPAMVVVPAGTFVMGSPDGEEERDEDEAPQHKVTIPSPFAVSKFPITFDKWDACVADGGSTKQPNDEGWGRGTRPVIGVNWNDAQTFVSWLKQKTGKPYRLLSEAEWEYAARAGTYTAYCVGDTIDKAHANFDGDKTTPVGAYAANNFGLHDMHGNVWEWVEDCWNASYDNAPADGSAWTSGDCEMRILRGGSWFSGSRLLRSAERLRYLAEIETKYLGFRVARDLD